MSFAGCSTHVVCVFHDGSANNKVSITVKGCERQYDAVCCCHSLHLFFFFCLPRIERRKKGHWIRQEIWEHVFSIPERRVLRKEGEKGAIDVQTVRRVLWFRLKYSRLKMGWSCCHFFFVVHGFLFCNCSLLCSPFLSFCCIAAFCMFGVDLQFNVHQWLFFSPSSRLFFYFNTLLSWKRLR